MLSEQLTAADDLQAPSQCSRRRRPGRSGSDQHADAVAAEERRVRVESTVRSVRGTQGQDILGPRAVAHLRLGPTSSASISVTDRLSPSGVSQERVRSRPTTMARVPLVSDSAAFSASCRQTLTRKNEVSPSFQESPSRTRAVTASRKLATAVP